MNVFLLYLVIKFAMESARTETKDLILEKKVPHIVFLQNQKLMTDLLKDKLENDKEAKESLKQKAELNEYMYNIMKNHGVVCRLDEAIGVEFIDFNIHKLTGKYRYGGYIMKSCSQPQKY